MKHSKLFLVLITTFLLVLTAACSSDGHVHIYGKWVITTEPTLTQKGEAYRECECGDKVEVKISDLSNEKTWKILESIEPTCSTKGKTTYTSRYGEVVVEKEMLSHEYGEWKLIVEPSKTVEGKASHTCKFGEEEEVIVPVLTDETVWTLTDKKAATCTTSGNESYESVYGTVNVVFEATGHTYGKWTLVTEPTLTEAGSAQKECHCGDKVTEVVPSLTDATVWTVNEKAATCTENGERVYTSVYGTVKVVLEATGHTYGKWTLVTEPTLTEAGSAQKECHCGDKVTEVVPSLADTTIWTLSSEVLPTYREDGKQVYTSTYGTVEVVLDKLVAPYDGKTYGNFLFDADDDANGFINGVIKIETAWGKATLTLNNKGEGEGTAFPFRGLNIFTMIDPSTGKMSIKQVPYASDEDGNTYLNYEDVTVFEAYVDLETGIIVRPHRVMYNDIIVLTPFETDTTSSNAVASAWDDAIAVEYTVNENVYRIFVYKSVVYFGVSFVDGDNKPIAANECYNAPLLYVKDAKGEVISGFAYNGTKEVVVDGYEGKYLEGTNELVLSGFGTALYNGEAGTYTKLSENVLAVSLSNAYYEVTLDKTTKQFTSEKPMVEITFVTNEQEVIIANIVTNKNVKINLPIPTIETKVFGGWYLDAECTKPVPNEYVPTSDVTLYTVWKDKVVINLVGVLEGDESVKYLGAGEKIGSILPNYTVDLVTKRVFKGWYLDAEYTEAVSEEAEVTVDDNNVTIYAKWEELPAYFGSYKGSEIWGKNSGGSSYVSLNIDAEGNITGKFTGVVVSYDKETQKITWKPSASSSTSYGFWFDEETGLLATHYNSKTEIGTDYYLFSMTEDSKCIKGQYGINCNKPSSTLTGYYARLVDIVTKQGQKLVFIYGDSIYSNITVSSAKGEALDISSVGSSKTVVVRNAETDDIILALASKGESFDKERNTISLDPYFGTYQAGEKTVILDGTGVIVYDGLTGTYELTASGASYGFDVYLNENAEYYQLTLDGKNAIMVKPMVTINYVVGEGHTEVLAQEVNSNINFVLPVLTEDNFVFNGWYLDAEFTKAVGTSFVPTENVTLYAKFSNPADLTIVYNNGEANDVIRYSVGDIVEILDPEYTKHKFEGWYTSEDFAEGTEWKSGTEITVDTTIYAKWSDAPKYNNKYLPVEVSGTNKDGKESYIYTRTAAILDINPNGVGTASGYPFSGTTTVTKYDKDTNTIQLTNGTKVYNGVIDPVSGIIILTYNSGETAVLGEVYFLTPFISSTNSSFASSYWNSGLTRCIEYTYDNTTYTCFVKDGKVYFDVTFKDAEGNAVNGKECYHSATLYVYDNENNLIAKYGFDGTTQNDLDGYEGKYTNGEQELTLDGVKVATLDSVKGEYILVEGAEYTLDAYIDNVYYEITLDVENRTFTINKPMVTITFVSEHTSVDAITLNKNIKATLPAPTNSAYKFRNWYLDAELTQKVDNEYTPTTDVTLYAKWDALVILTVVYGNTLSDEQFEYGVGDIPSLAIPPYTEGKVFNGWYLDAELTNAYTLAALENNLTIYCAWIEAVPQFGKYKGFETYGTSSSSVSLWARKDLNVDALGNVTGELEGTISEYDATTGAFIFTKKANSKYKYLGYFDAANGILVISYNSITEGKEPTLGTDVYVYFSNATTVTGDKSLSAHLEQGKARLVKVSFTGYKDTEVYIYIDNEKVYYNVTFKANGEDVSISKANSSSNLQIFDSNNNVIATYEKGSKVTA